MSVTQLLRRQQSVNVLHLDEVLPRLETMDARHSAVVEQSFVGGLTQEEIAGSLSISEAAVHRELRFAKAGLYKELQPQQETA